MTNKQDKSAAFNQGILIFVYLAALTALEFFIALALNAIVLLIAVALVKAGLVVYYYMHVHKLNEDSEDDRESYEYKSGTNRMGLWLFLISDAFVFGGLLVMRLNLLGLTRPPLNQLLGLGITTVLLISSFFMNRAETSMEHGDRKGFVTNVIVTLVLGVGFLVGVLGMEWPMAMAEGITPSSGAPGAVFFMMTGMHAFHVLTGVIFLLVVLRNGSRGQYDEKHFPVEAAAVYWHFVDVVWIFFYPALYLIGALT